MATKKKCDGVDQCFLVAVTFPSWYWGTIILEPGLLYTGIVFLGLCFPSDNMPRY